MVVHHSSTTWHVLPVVANGAGSREQDFPEPALTTRMGSPIFITTSGQEPDLICKTHRVQPPVPGAHLPGEVTQGVLSEASGYLFVSGTP